MTGIVFGSVLIVVVVALPLFTFEKLIGPMLAFLGIAYLAWPVGTALHALAVFTSGFAYCCVSVWLYKLYFKFIQKNGNGQQGDPTPAQ